MTTTDQPWLLPMMNRIFTALDDGGVRWALLRGGADLEEIARDVDLLVAPDDLPALERVVAELGGVPLPRWLQGWHRFYWFRHSGLTNPGVMLDVVTALTYGRDGRLPTDLAAGCLQRRVHNGSVYELSATDTFWTILLHCLLDKGGIKERRAQELTAALPSLVRPSDAESVVETVCPAGWSAELLVEGVRHGDWDQLGQLGRSLVAGGAGGQVSTGDEVRPDRRPGLVTVARRHLPKRDSSAGNAAKTAYAAGWQLTQTIRKRTTMARKDKPVRVSLSGLDGSGKSRQTAALTAYLSTLGTVELVWIPFDIWPGSMLKLLPTSVRVRLGPRGRTLATEHLTAEELADRKKQQESGAPAPVPTASTPTLSRAFWWSVATFAAVSAGVSLRRRLERVEADIVVLDRYRLDTTVKLQSWYPAVSPTWLAQIVLRLTPTPDMECLLRVSGTEAYARKPEQYNVTQLTRQAALFDRLVDFVPGAFAVDGEDDPDAVTRELCERARQAVDGR